MRKYRHQWRHVDAASIEFKIVSKFGTFWIRIDRELLDQVLRYRWHLHRTGHKSHVAQRFYVARNYQADGKWKRDHLHRLVMSAAEDTLVDFISNETFDNRRCNLRFGTHAESTRNQNKKQKRTGVEPTSRYKGVSRVDGQWKADVMLDYVTVYSELFDSEVEAARMRDCAAIEHHKEFASLNFKRLGNCQ